MLDADATKMCAVVRMSFNKEGVGAKCEFVNPTPKSPEKGEHQWVFTFDSLGDNTLYLGPGKKDASREINGNAWRDHVSFGGLPTTYNNADFESYDSYWTAGMASLTWGLDQQVGHVNIIKKFEKKFELDYWRIKTGFGRYMREIDGVSYPPPLGPEISDGEAILGNEAVSQVDSWEVNDAGTHIAYKLKEDRAYGEIPSSSSPSPGGDWIATMIHGKIKGNFTYGANPPDASQVVSWGQTMIILDYSTAKSKEKSDSGLFRSIKNEDTKYTKFTVDSEGLFLGKPNISTNTNTVNWPGLMFYFAGGYLQNPPAAGPWVDVYSYQHRAVPFDDGGRTPDNFDWIHRTDGIGAFGNSFKGWNRNVAKPEGESFRHGQIGEFATATPVWPTMSFPAISYGRDVGGDYPQNEKTQAEEGDKNIAPGGETPPDDGN